MQKRRISFIAIGVPEQVLYRNEFYKQDIDILKSLECEVRIHSRITADINKCDVAFVWWWSWLWMIGPIMRLSGVPILATGSLDPHEYDRMNLVKQYLVRFGTRFPENNIFVSKYMLNQLGNRFRIERASVCPHIVPDTYRPDPSVERDQYTILSISWKKRENVRRKMQTELIDAFSLALKRLPQLKLILAGEPVDGEIDLRKRVAELGIQTRVEFLGAITRDHKIQLMRQCAVYYQCSRSEGFGLAIAEAMACGAAVLVNRNSAIPEVVGESGYYVSSDRIEAIAEGICDLISKPKVRAQLGVSAASRVDTHFRDRVRSEFIRREILKLLKKE